MQTALMDRIGNFHASRGPGAVAKAPNP